MTQSGLGKSGDAPGSPGKAVKPPGMTPSWRTTQMTALRAVLGGVGGFWGYVQPSGVLQGSATRGVPSPTFTTDSPKGVTSVHLSKVEGAALA